MSSKEKTSGITDGALRHPITVYVVVLAMALASFLGIQKMPRDILPSLGVPIIYVAQPYGGLDPSQMESYLTYYYEYHFLYISGIEHVESKSIQSAALIKLQFHPGTDMAQAMAETIGYVNRARAFMPTGTLPPFVVRFDSGSEPVGKLVFSSETRSLGEMQNYALNFVRPLFATLPGVSAPPPFGASPRTIVIEVDPKKLKQRDLSADQVTNAIVAANQIVPSGNIHVGTKYPIVPMNGAVTDIQQLLDTPLRPGMSNPVFLRDFATVRDTTDIPTSFALVNGKRTVYIPVTKRADASTLAVVDLVKKNLPRFRSVLPDDIHVDYEFDQSGYVRRAIGSLFWEAVLGAILTGLMVLAFLRDWRSVLIVVLNIPLALLSALLALWMTKQTVNIMTLGGLALAVGILVDETTVTIENIHAHLAKGASVARATLDATNEILRPALLTLLCVLSVFIPSFFMEGVAKSLFVPLTLAVGFSMIGSFILSRTLVPVLSAWFLKPHPHSVESHAGKFSFSRLQDKYESTLQKLSRFKRVWVLFYLSSAIGVVAFCAIRIGTELFPQVDVGQFQIRLRASTGTSIENTEKDTLEVLKLIRERVGEQNVEGSIAFIGTQPAAYPINTIYLWTGGPHEAVLEVALKAEAKINLEDFKEKLRADIREKLPDVTVSFEPSSMVDRTMSQGSTTPIEVAVNGSSLASDREFAEKIHDALAPLPFLRDLQYGQRLDFPSISVDVDRRKAAFRGLTVAQIGQSLVPATSSSRFLVQNYWVDPKNGISYQVQVQVPRDQMTSAKDLGNVTIPGFNGDAVLLGKIADIHDTTRVGEYDRYNMQRMVTLTANLHGIDLGHATQEINQRLKSLDEHKPRGVEIHTRGQMTALKDMLNGLGTGLLLAIVVVFLLLSANFESTTLSLSVLSTVPAVLAGSLTLLMLTGTTLNIESFMGLIMSIGVAVANSILLVTFAERSRISQGNIQNGAVIAAIEGARSRLRPILMTSFAMLAGMIPMALGLGEGGQQTAPLGRAVIGGLLGSTAATLLVLPMAFAWIQGRRSTHGASLHPDDRSAAPSPTRVSVIPEKQTEPVST